MKRILPFLLSQALLLGLCPQTAFAAPAWPDNITISAEGGIVMDADTGVVLYGKNSCELFSCQHYQDIDRFDHY